MVGSDFFVPPVETRLLPLVTRKSGVRDYQKRNNQDLSGHADSEKKRDREPERGKRPRPDCIVTETKIDCKI